VPPGERLTSRQSTVVRRFRQVAAGDDEELVLLDGEHLVRDAIDAGVAIEILLTDGRAPALAGKARAAGASVHEGSEGVLEAASPVRTPSGVVALARWRTAPLIETFAASGAGLYWLGLVGVQDPGNVGSAIRAADALGASGVLALDATANPRGSKTLRGAMGSSFHVPVSRSSIHDALAEARRREVAIVASVAAGGTPIASADLRGRVLFLAGAEGSGLPPDLVARADVRVTIPMRAGVDSINVAVSAAILLFEARRQRSADAGRGRS